MSATVSLERLGKHLGGRWILRDVTHAWSGAGVLAVCGPNGAGKSTLLRLIAGALTPDMGDVQLNGHSLARNRARALECVGYAPAVSALPAHLRVRELLALVASLRGASAHDSARGREGLELDALLDDPCGTLSLGQKRRVTLAVARTGLPPLVLLDEPTNGLDASARERFHGWLDAHVHAGGGAMIATHDAAFIARTATARWDIAHSSVHDTAIDAPLAPDPT